MKGAYREPATLAYPRKADVDQQYFSLAMRLLETRDQQLRPPAFGTHDIHLIDRVLAGARGQNVAEVSDNAFVPVLELIHRIKNEGIGPISVVAGGTPTFPVHALREGVESSPGTLILWDYGYSSSFADMAC